MADSIEKAFATFLASIPSLAGLPIEPIENVAASTLPRLRYFRVSELNRTLAMSGKVDLDETRMQVDVFASTYSAADVLAETIASYDGYKGTPTVTRNIQLMRVSKARDIAQPKTTGAAKSPVFQKSVDVTIWHNSRAS